MRRFVTMVVPLLALLGFYVAWPAWSAYEIKSALDARDAARLERKIDFPSVRASLQPLVLSEVQRRMDQALAELGAAGALLGPRLREELAPKLAEQALVLMLTPEGVVRLVAEGTTLKEIIEKVSREQGDRLPRGVTLGGGRSGGPVVRTIEPGGAPAPGAANTKRPLGLANVKHLVPTGLASFEIGVARDPAATASDVVVTLAFTGGDWKVVGLRPRV